MVFITFRVKIYHDDSKPVSDMAALEIQCYLIILLLLISVGVGRGISSFHEHVDQFSVVIE
jgi:hypothetical protein